MPRTRSRPRTEEKFQHAVLKLVAEDGCGSLGINSVAKLAGADKVLIYRYFGDFNGLLQRVADSRQWLPSCGEMLEALSGNEEDGLSRLRRIERILSQHIRGDASTHQLVRWRRTNICPICETFSEEWHRLWQALPSAMSQTLATEQRTLWSQACALLALTIEADLCGEPVDRRCLENIARGLETGQIEASAESEPTIKDDSLPTNLL